MSDFNLNNQDFRLPMDPNMAGYPYNQQPSVNQITHSHQEQNRQNTISQLQIFLSTTTMYLE